MAKVLRIKPEDFLGFIYEHGFDVDWKRLALTDDNRVELEYAVMNGWRRARIIEETGGLRKLRFAPSQWNTGKSGATRILFVVFERFATAVMIMAFGKSEKDNISTAEKREIKKWIAQIERDLEEAQKRREARKRRP